MPGKPASNSQIENGKFDKDVLENTKSRPGRSAKLRGDKAEELSKNEGISGGGIWERGKLHRNGRVWKET